MNTKAGWMGFEDNPHVRADGSCPLCWGEKPMGNVACWPCYRLYSMKYGNPEAEAQISNRERALEASCRATAPGMHCPR